MNLPPPSPPGAPNPRIWAAVTIQSAWELQTLGVRSTPALLREVRRHVLLSLPHNATEDFADERTGAYVREFLWRFRAKNFQHSPPPDPPMALDPRWRDALVEDLDPIGTAVWRLIYSDGLSLEVAEQRCGVDRVVLSGACEGLRCALRSLVGDSAPANLIDALLARLARMPGPDCDGGASATTASKEHLEGCPRCCRALRLIKAGALTGMEVVAPAVWMKEQVSVLALNLHPEGRQHWSALLKTFGKAVIPAGDDTLLLNLDRAANHVLTLHALAEEGTPPRHHLRGALVRGPGHWLEHGITGPVAAVAINNTRSKQWGEVDTVGTLPEVLPPPPSAVPWWSAAILTALSAALVGATALKTPASPPPYPVEELSISRQEDKMELRFDVDDRANTLVVIDGPDGVKLLHADATPADKGLISTGEGDYSLSAPAGSLLVASSPAPFDQAEVLVELVRIGAQPLEDLASRFNALHDNRVAFVIKPLSQQP